MISSNVLNIAKEEHFNKEQKNKMPIRNEHDLILSFEINDTGIGISKEQQHLLFLSFSQTDSSTSRKYGGTGLGLYISQLLANKLNGSISILSEKDKGSTFTLVLNLNQTDCRDLIYSLTSQITMEVVPKDLQKEVIENGSFSFQKNIDSKTFGSVLIAEDVEDNQKLLAVHLRKLNLDFVFANNGQEAIEKAFSGDFDLIIMDIQMPIMDGYTAVEILRQKGFTKPIIALTANAMKEDIEKCIQAGCDIYLQKPITRQVLFDVLNLYLS